MEKKFKLPKNCKGFTVKSLENGDFEVIYEIDQKVRASSGDKYYIINDLGEVVNDYEDLVLEDVDRFNFGNYFTTEEQAKKALFYIKAAFDKFWEDENKSSSN